MWRLSRPDALIVFEDQVVRRSLGRYFSILKNEKNAKFIVAKKLAAEWCEHDSIDKLWAEHAKGDKEFQSFERTIDKGKQNNNFPSPTKSYFDLKTRIAKKILQNCHFCTRRCGVNRITSGLGYCGCGDALTVSSITAHTGEEPELVPSGTIFTMGCTIRCQHCQNWTISQWNEQGTEYTSEEMAKEVEQLYLSGCRNANLVGGEPTPWLTHWLETFEHVNVNIPVVWNSNSYYSQETARLLRGFVDVYLLDFKYGPAECAARISNAPNYWTVCTRNHLEAKANGELIIRVLILPNHLTCCTKPIVEWIAEKLGVETRVNLMFQYRPEWRAHEIPELRRRLTKDEMNEAIYLAKSAGLENTIT